MTQETKQLIEISVIFFVVLAVLFSILIYSLFKIDNERYNAFKKYIDEDLIHQEALDVMNDLIQQDYNKTKRHTAYSDKDKYIFIQGYKYGIRKD